MPSQLSEFLHFAITLFLTTPSQLNRTWIKQQSDFDPNVANVLRGYGFTEDEIQAIKNEIFGNVNNDESLTGGLGITAFELHRTLTVYDGTGVHPNDDQAKAIVKTLRPLAVLPNF